MLELSSPRWANLTHAHGEASNLPELLSRLASEDETAVEELSSALCHQGSVYAASFAAVPHLVHSAGQLADPDLKANALILVGLIASSEDDRSKETPPLDIDTAYRAALPEALRLAISTLALDFEPYDAVYLLQTAAWLNGFSTLGRVLSGFLDEEFTIDCPKCEHELYVWPNEDEAGFSTAAEDPIKTPLTPRTPIIAGPALNSPLAPQYRWLLEVGGESALSVIGQQLPYLFGTGICPLCDAPFTLLNQLSDAP